MTDRDWRADEAWALADYDPEFWGDRTPPDRPTADAELAQPDSWSSLYDGRRVVATWTRARA